MNFLTNGKLELHHDTKESLSHHTRNVLRCLFCDCQIVIVNSMTAYVKQMKNVTRCQNIYMYIYSMGNQSFEIRLDLFDEIKYYYVFLWHFGTSY